MEDVLYGSESVPRFCLGEAAGEGVPVERSIRRFRHLLEEHRLQEKLMLRVNKFLSDKGILTKVGTIVDATIIHAPTSTKNESKQRDPEMPHTKRGDQFYFGMKCHVGVRYRGLMKNSYHLTTLCMLASLYLKRKVLAHAWG